MHLLEPHIDELLMAEMRDEGVLTPRLLEKMDQQIGGAEAIRLSDALLLIADDMPENIWINWLVHVHNCARLHKIFVDSAMLREAGFSRAQARAFIESGNYPAVKCRDGWMVALTRPDLFARTAEALPGVPLFRLAPTLPEARELKRAFTRIT